MGRGGEHLMRADNIYVLYCIVLYCIVLHCIALHVCMMYCMHACVHMHVIYAESQ